jgi:hypothetical protein
MQETTTTETTTETTTTETATKTATESHAVQPVLYCTAASGKARWLAWTAQQE